jgi:hypothetical protein
MDTNIYGVDMSKDVTPIMVRDAIIKCYIEAHSKTLEEMRQDFKFKSEEEFQNMKKMNVVQSIKLQFEKKGADFDNPLKEDLTKVLEGLAKFSANFRESEEVKKHYDEIMQLVNKL